MALRACWTSGLPRNWHPQSCQPRDAPLGDWVPPLTMKAIVKRVNELKVAHPELAGLFERYIRSQEAECDELEGETVAVTWLLQV